MQAHRWSAALGLVAWLAAAPFVAAATPELAWVQRFVLLAALVVVPLAWGALGPPQPPAAGFVRGVRVAQPGAALLAAASATMATGPGSALLLAPWLAVTTLLAAAEAWRLALLVRPQAQHAAAAAAALFLPVGAFWWFVSRLGAPVLGFGDPLAILTAVHFHYAGFAALVLAALLARAAAPRGSTFVVALAVLGMPVTAAGITLAYVGHPAGAWIGVAGAALVVSAFTATAALTLAAALRHPEWGAARWLLAAAGLAGVAGIPWGLAWAWDGATGDLGLTIARMVRVHGAVNAVGFVLPALLAWNLVRAPADAAAPALRVGLRSVLSPGAAVAASASSAPGASAASPMHAAPRWEDEYHADLPGPGAFERARALLLAYAVGPPAGFEAAAGRPLAAGMVVPQAARWGPLAFAMEVEILAVEDRPERVRVDLRTRPGHPIDGAKTYLLERTPEGAAYTLRVATRPGTWLLALGAPVLRRRQLRDNAAAVAFLRERVVGDAQATAAGPAGGGEAAPAGAA